MELNDLELSFIEKTWKNSKASFSIFPFALPAYFISNAILNWKDFGLPGGITIIVLSFLIMAVLYQHINEQKKLLAIVEKLLNNKRA